MRQLKADVSHRMRRRPSIFSTRWFRVVLAAGAMVVLALAFGPSLVTGLRGSAATRNAGLSPASSDPVTGPSPVERERAEPAAAGSVRPEPPAAPSPAPAANGQRTARPERAGGGPAPSAATPPAAKPTAAASDGAQDSPAPAVFRVQVGAFLDHRNADRLVARLRNESFEVVDSVMEQSRVLYRVLVTPPPAEGYDALMAELTRLGFTPEMKGDSVVVTGPIPLHEAVEASRALRDRRLQVRLERQPSSGSFRVVRVGGYRTAEEAERVRAQLAASGLEGVVVQER